MTVISMTMTDPTIPITIHQVIDVVGGVILLLAAYYALQARRSDNAAYRQEYGRAVAQCIALFLVLAYTAFVFFPESRAWPVRTGYHLYHFFDQLDTVPSKADAHLTDYYLVLLRQIGYATGTGTGPASPTMPGVLGTVEGTVRTVGLVVYTLVFTVVSLSLQVPSRIIGGIQDVLGD